MTQLDHSGIPEPLTTSPPVPASPTGKQRAAMAVLLTASFTLAVDFSVLNVALPAIGAEVGFSLTDLQWIATSFALCAAGFTLFFGRIADLFGRRRLFLLGMAALGISSLVGGLAETPSVLLAARVVQGLATAAITPAALSLLTTTFPEGPMRDRVLGLNGALMAAGFTTGAVLGGVLADLLSWRWAFFLNVPVAAAVLIIAPLVLAEARPAQRPRLDLPGAITVTAALLAIVYGLTQAGETSWVSPGAYGPLLLGAVLLVAFWAIEKRATAPLVPMRVLGRRSIAWGNIAGLLAFVTETSLVFLLTLYLQEVLGYSPLLAGLSFAVLGLGTVLGGILGPKVIGALGAKQAIVLGLTVQGVATVPLVFLSENPTWVFVILAMTFLGGIANLVAIVGFMVTVTSGLPDHEQGLGTGLATMSQQVGITMGIPIMSAIAAAQITAAGTETAASVLHGVSVAIAANAGLCLLAAAALALALPRQRVSS